MFRGVKAEANPFRVKQLFCDCDPGLSLVLQPWAEISQRLRRNLDQDSPKPLFTDELAAALEE
jgi:hypothetical protein